MVKTVKARAHHGASSLNLTIPAEICRKYGIAVGDIFELNILEKERLVLAYKKVYSSTDR